ncbi:zinc-binding dehydrogenase [Actinomadura livida]|uniref:NADPH:quinone reductase-like Zn-dependent oxidoreductase n=1 Tax=Actinomadura livida TaxID=79909 RepID=A0A7W7IKG2_9ACTN|nr:MULTISPECIES: zinc-binding dehydrogenase [Actinomadura]MBB4778757.1 NADPH:quinone reductase-like Zn-dependent oxidoreductase [Actinomadura catellatispora]GGU36397.1 alcohol dehydrogenase [Actinomadura livida]
MKALVQTGFGGPEVVSLRHIADPVPGPRDVLVRVRACALNRLDVLQRRGPAVLPGFRLPHIAGMDVAGHVAAAGDEAAGYAPGDRVVVDPTHGCGTCPRCAAGEPGHCAAVRVIGGNTAGGFAEYVRVPARLVHRVPGHVDLAEAAALPSAWSTAWRATVTVGAAAPGETVLVQAAASGVSIAAVQLAKRAGARVVAVAGSDAKLALAADLGADLLLHNDADVVAAVRRFTGGEGADLALDHVGAATWQTSLDSLRAGGRLVTFGNTTGDEVTLSLAGVYHRGLRVLGTGAYTEAEFAAMLDAYFGGGLRTVRMAEYGMDELPAAFAAAESRAAIGKILVRP